LHPADGMTVSLNYLQTTLVLVLILKLYPRHCDILQNMTSIV